MLPPPYIPLCESYFNKRVSHNFVVLPTANKPLFMKVNVAGQAHLQLINADPALQTLH